MDSGSWKQWFDCMKKGIGSSRTRLVWMATGWFSLDHMGNGIATRNPKFWKRRGHSQEFKALLLLSLKIQAPQPICQCLQVDFDLQLLIQELWRLEWRPETSWVRPAGRKEQFKNNAGYVRQFPIEYSVILFFSEFKCSTVSSLKNIKYTIYELEFPAVATCYVVRSCNDDQRLSESS